MELENQLLDKAGSFWKPSFSSMLNCGDVDTNQELYMTEGFPNGSWIIYYFGRFSLIYCNIHKQLEGSQQDFFLNQLKLILVDGICVSPSEFRTNSETQFILSCVASRVGSPGWESHALGVVTTG